MLVPTARPAQPGWAEDRCIMEYLNIANLKKLLHAKQISLVSQGLALNQPLDALSGGLCMLYAHEAVPRRAIHTIIHTTLHHDAL